MHLYKGLVIFSFEYVPLTLSLYMHFSPTPDVYLVALVVWDNLPVLLKYKLLLIQIVMKIQNTHFLKFQYSSTFQLDVYICIIWTFLPLAKKKLDRNNLSDTNKLIPV